MKSKVAERIMDNYKKSPRIEKIISKAKSEPRKVIKSKPVDPMTEIYFTATLKRYGIMKWLESRKIIKPRIQGIQIFMNKLGVPTYVSTLNGNNKYVCTLNDIIITIHPTIINK